MELRNERLKGKKIVTAHGTLVFDENGVLTEPKLTEEQVKSFEGLKGYQIGAESDNSEETNNTPTESEEGEETKDEAVEVAEDEENKEPSISYGDMTVDELKDEAYKRNLEVEGTGRKGSVLRKDLVKALVKHDESKK